jgi:hypothetical protein
MMVLATRYSFTTILHMYQSRFIPEGLAEASQIFLRDATVLLKLFTILWMLY